MTGLQQGILRLYQVFHLNLAYSSIEDSERARVVDKAYWPLLHAVADLDIPIGIEAPAYTLEKIAESDPAWIDELRNLIHARKCEFIGSGYAQLIGPLVPAKVNAKNLQIGKEVYERMLGIHPNLALINEQAYSTGLLRNYINAGYQAILMEWDNPASAYLHWDPEWRYFPQIAVGQDGEELPVIWGASIAFQKFQRYAHGELELPQYVEYLASQRGAAPRYFPMYTNDAEVFDFRPARYQTEASIHEDGEWSRIRSLYETLAKDPNILFIHPSEVLAALDQPSAGNRLSLGSPAQPIPVKKQGKYNITRWAVTGRDDLGINTRCWRIYDALVSRKETSMSEWRELCYLWSSDFRTHITEARWARYLERLNTTLETHVPEAEIVEGGAPESPLAHPSMIDGHVRREGHYLQIDTDSTRLRLNLRKGLAVDRLWFGNLQGPHLCGTLPHGFFDDIRFAADWFTGHAVLDLPGRHKITDLQHVEPEIAWDNGTNSIVIRASIQSSLGPILKRISIRTDQSEIQQDFEFFWPNLPVASLRLGMITLNPEAFHSTTLAYRTHNGGVSPETFGLRGEDFDHGESVSFLVSAKNCLGMTEGWVEVGDHERSLRVAIDKKNSALIGLVGFQRFAGSYFARLAFSAREMDETCREGPRPGDPLRVRFSIGPGNGIQG